MKPLDEATRQFRLYYLLTAVRACDGSMQRAAALIGIHRNSCTRIMRESGYSLKRMREEARTL